jgi:hypothetical protein
MGGYQSRKKRKANKLAIAEINISSTLMRNSGIERAEKKQIKSAKSISSVINCRREGFGKIIVNFLPLFSIFKSGGLDLLRAIRTSL